MNNDINYTQTLADFVSGTHFSDFPEEVVEYTKLLILDTLICGISAGRLERSKMMHEAVKQLGENKEATIFGLAGKYSAASAAMANAEIMNCLDADDTFFTTSHFAAFNVAAALAESQRCGASGKDIILGTAAGFDVNARLSLASVIVKQAEDGSIIWAPLGGMGFAAFGSAASAASIRKLSQEQMRNVFGLVGWMAPTPVFNTMVSRSHHPTMKYANYPGTAQAGMMAVYLAEQGYVGQQDCLDGKGFLMAQGCLDTRHDILLDELGEKWWILESCIKYYPSCRYTHGPIDMLQKLMAEEGLQASDIEKMVIRMNPAGYALNFFRNPAKSIEFDHCAPLNGAFNIPYVMALAALGRTPGPQWYSEENLRDSEVWRLAEKISTAEDETARDDAQSALEGKIRRFRKAPASMSVWAGGREYLCECEYVNGDPWTAETKASWESVTEKFLNFCTPTFSETKILNFVEQIKHLENIDDVAKELDLKGF